MSVRNRIKILECKSYQEVENKVNDFLAFNEDIAQLIAIDYRLEYNIVIIEYYVFAADGDNNNKNFNNEMFSSIYDLGVMSYTDTIKCWMKLCSFPPL